MPKFAFIITAEVQTLLNPISRSLLADMYRYSKPDHLHYQSLYK